MDNPLPTPIAKEIEGTIEMADLGLTPSSPELNLPKEVRAVGVSAHPTIVPIPPAVSQMGVKATGSNVPATQAATIALPLTDDQIAVGLKKSVKVSFRWLAEWCVRKLKQLHSIMKNPKSQ